MEKTKMTLNGVSICPAGEERYEYYASDFTGRKGKLLCQYDYRHTDGELFSCIAPTLEECRANRNDWLNRKKDEYETLIITFAEPISTLDSFFDDPEAWGVATLKKWVDSYESTRFTAIDDCRAVVTSEYNMANVREWLERYMPIANIKEM